MEVTNPVRAQSAVQSALPRDQTIYYCAPDSIEMVGIVGGYKGMLMLFGALMSFSTRSVSENFNESKPIAFSVSSLLSDPCSVGLMLICVDIDL
jgi:hypothetical protein